MKTAFITGANRGLGKAFVEYLLQNNYQVFAGMRDTSKYDLEHNDLCPIKIDLSSDTAIKKAVQKIQKHTSTLDLLINNAGVNSGSATNGQKDLVNKLDTLDRDKLALMFDVNTIGPMLLVKECLDLLQNNPSFVINISSCRASFHDEYEQTKGNYGYCASKVALNMMTFCSLFDLPKNIQTFAVHPGSVQTDMNPTGEMKAYNQAEKIISITKQWKPELNGKFLNYDGRLYPL